MLDCEAGHCGVDMKKKPKVTKKKRDNEMRFKQEGQLIAKLCMVHHYVIMPKPRVNMVMNLKTKEVTPHLEYKFVVPADSILAKVIPFKGKNEYIEKVRPK